MSWYDIAAFLNEAYAVYPMDSFCDDTNGNYIWEKTDSSRDLIKGDGSTASTFPTFTENSDHDVAYYAFDGVDDYLSGWPEMPEEYTVVIAKSTSYPDGQPEIQSCNDTTIETLLTTPGSYTGNIHNILIFDSELNATELGYCEEAMLKRLWRDTFADPFISKEIRSEDCALCLYCEEFGDRFDDYSQNGIGSTDYSTDWEKGITFPVAGAAVVMDSDTALNLEELTIFIESPNFDTDDSYGDEWDATIIQNGTNYSIVIEVSASGVCTMILNSSSFEFPLSGYRTVAVTVTNGAEPLWYLNGTYAGEGDLSATVSSAGAGQLTIGNNTARNNPIPSTLKKISIYSRILSPLEIRAVHIGSMADRPFS